MQVQIVRTFLYWGKKCAMFSTSHHAAVQFFFSFLWHQWPQRKQELTVGKQTSRTSCSQELGAMEASSKGKLKLVLWLSYNQVKSLKSCLTTEEKLWEIETKKSYSTLCLKGTLGSSRNTHLAWESYQDWIKLMSVVKYRGFKWTFSFQSYFLSLHAPLLNVSA